MTRESNLEHIDWLQAELAKAHAAKKTNRATQIQKDIARYLDLEDGYANEYESAAEWCARRGYRGVMGEPLPALLSARVVEDINNDIHAFQARVRVHLYAIACAGRPDGE